MWLEKDVVIYGGGMLGHYMFSLLSGNGFPSIRVIGFVDDALPSSEDHLNTGLKLLGNLNQLKINHMMHPGNVSCIFAIGYSDMRARLAAFNNAKEIGYEFITLAHPSSIILEGAKLGEGSFLGPGAILDAGSKIGTANFIDAGCVISEKVVMQSGNYLSPKVVICGNTSIGTGNFFGASVTVRDGLMVGDNNFLSMQTLLVRNITNDILVSETRNITFLK